MLWWNIETKVRGISGAVVRVAVLVGGNQSLAIGACEVVVENIFIRELAAGSTSGHPLYTRTRLRIAGNRAPPRQEIPYRVVCH